MGKLLEHHSKQLIRQLGLKAPKGAVAATPGEAAEIAAELGVPVVVKALVPVGKRGKAGAVKFADSPAQAALAAEELIGITVSNFPVENLLVEEKLEIKEEWYLSITFDKEKKMPVIIAGTRGGIDVEEINRTNPESLLFRHVDPFWGLLDYQAKEIWSELGVSGKKLTSATGLLVKLYQLFDRSDAALLEINPLAVTSSEELVIAASVMSVDDSAMYRHPELSEMVQIGSDRAWRPLTELEKRMVEVNEADPYRGTARYTEMPGGDIGFMCGGGGGSLLCFDALVDNGGKPANYTEVGGNPPEQKVYGLTRGILSKPGVKGLFVAHNITNNTQVDVLARGIVRALEEMNIDPDAYPVVVREAGVNDAAAREIFTSAGVEYYGDDITMTEAAARMVRRMEAAYPGYRQQEGD